MMNYSCRDYVAIALYLLTHVTGCAQLGMTALMYAAAGDTSGHANIVSALLEEGASITIQNQVGVWGRGL